MAIGKKLFVALWLDSRSGRGVGAWLTASFHWPRGKLFQEGIVWQE